jgi:carboxymethylenebutenolidase
MTTAAAPHLTPAQHALLDVWQTHVVAEFVTKHVQDALDTMTEDASVNHVPLLLGGLGKEGVRAFYAKSFVAQMPPDLESSLISRTIGEDRLVEESVFRFTHSRVMDWLLPGVPPTGKRLEVAVVGIIQFRAGKIAHDPLDWDQASVLVQVGLLDAPTLPVAGVASARRLLDPSVPMNALRRRAHGSG